MSSSSSSSTSKSTFLYDVSSGDFVGRRNWSGEMGRTKGMATGKGTTTSTFARDTSRLLKLYKYLGFLPVIFHSETEGKISPLWCVYAIAVHSSYLAEILISNVHGVPLLRLPTKFYNHLIVINNCIFLGAISILCISHWLNVKSYIQYRRQWVEFMIDYEITFGKCPRIKISRTDKCFWAAYIFVVSYLICTGYESNSYRYAKFTFFHLCMMVPLVTWSFQAIGIRFIAKDYAEKLPAAFLFESRYRLQKVLEVWMRLQKLCEFTNDLFTGPMAVTLVVAFLYSVMCVYGQVKRIWAGLFFMKITLVSAMMLILSAGKIYYACNAGYFASKALGETVRKKILRLDFSRCDSYRIQKALFFLNSMKINEPALRIAGFVNINRELAVSIFSAIVTYVILLMQFHILTPIY